MKEEKIGNRGGGGAVGVYHQKKKKKKIFSTQKFKFRAVPRAKSDQPDSASDGRLGPSLAKSAAPTTNNSSPTPFHRHFNI